MKTAEIFKELILLTEKSLRNFAIRKIFITVNNQEIESWFHSFTSETRVDGFVSRLSYL